MLRGPRPKRGTAGLAHALQTFRVERENSTQGTIVAARLRSAHGPSPIASSMPPSIWSRSSSAALAPLETLPPGRTAFGAIAARHAEGVRRRSAAPPKNLAKAFDEIARPARSTSSPATMPSCSTPPSPTARCGGRRPTCGSASTARSKRACNRSTGWCWAASSRASGRRRRAPIPGSAARCATSSASTCRSGASACRRTTSPRRSAPAR